MAEGSSHTSFKRVQLACAPCHRSKLKCDRQLVCDQCLRRSRPQECVYTERGLRYNTARQQAALMRAKVDHLEKLFLHLKGSTTTNCQVGASCAFTRCSSEDIMVAGPTLKVKSLSQPAGNTQHIAPSHWESIVEHISDVKAYFDTGDERQPIYSNEDSMPGMLPTGPDCHFNISCLSSKDDLLSLLPAKCDVDRYVGTWFDSIDSMRLVVHVPSFQIDYQLFWQDIHVVDTQWLAMLFAIASVGAEICSQIRKDGPTRAAADQLRVSTAHAISLADSTRGKRWIIETLLIHARAHQLRKQDTDRQICLLAGFCARMTIMAGFHVDPSHNSALSPYVCEMRRRIWTAVCELEVTTSYQVGAFSAISTAKSDTRPPANLLDADFSREIVPESRSIDDFTPALYQAHYARLIEIFGDVVHASETLGRSTKVETDALHCRLVQARDSWPQVLRLKPFDQTFGKSNEVILCRYSLELLYLKAACVLFRDYLGTSGREENHCLAAAEELVRTQFTMLEGAQAGGKLASSTIYLKHHVHDFNLATMILCVDMTSANTATTQQELSNRFAHMRSVMGHVARLWLQIGVPARKARQGINAVLKYIDEEQSQVN